MELKFWNFNVPCKALICIPNKAFSTVYMPPKAHMAVTKVKKLRF